MEMKELKPFDLDEAYTLFATSYHYQREIAPILDSSKLLFTALFNVPS